MLFAEKKSLLNIYKHKDRNKYFTLHNMKYFLYN
jgi:hypothetical protein